MSPTAMARDSTRSLTTYTIQDLIRTHFRRLETILEVLKRYYSFILFVNTIPYANINRSEMYLYSRRSVRNVKVYIDAFLFTLKNAKNLQKLKATHFG